MNSITAFHFIYFWHSWHLNRDAAHPLGCPFLHALWKCLLAVQKCLIAVQQCLLGP